MNPAAAGVPGGRPSLHRVWSNNHYQHVSTSWRLAALDGHPKLLDWARICTDNYASIGQVRYAGLKGRVDGNGAHVPGAEFKYHNPGAFWHCKAFVPWGGRGYGMDRNDDDSGLTGHWPDPSGLLYAWLFDANRWAKDGYDLWLANVAFPTGGWRREINTSLVHAITAYEYQPNETTLAAIKGMGESLRSAPLAAQAPGPIFEPSWLSRYHEMFPDDAAFNKFIVENADAAGVRSEGIWTLALRATAYRITKNEEYLRRHAGSLALVVRQVFDDPGEDKRWDKYGFGPGPGRDGHFMLQWHRFYAALKDAKIDSLAAPDEAGQYLCGVSAWDNAADMQSRGTKILIWKEQPGPLTLNLQATTLRGGDLQATALDVLSPRGEKLLNIARLPMTSAQFVARTVRPSTWGAATESHAVTAREPGLYRAVLGSNEIGVFQPLTDRPECQVLRSITVQNGGEPGRFLAKLTHGYLVPLTKGKITLTFTAVGELDGSTLSLHDSRKQAVLARSLRAGDSVAVQLNDRGPSGGPWLLDAYSNQSGCLRLEIASDVDEPLLFGRRLEDLDLIRQKLGK